MGSAPICAISATGLVRPTLADCLAYFVAGYQGVYGSDVVVSADTQDGEFLGLLASALDDVNSECTSVYNAYSPATAIGAGLSSVVKINGLTRNVPTYSTVPVLILGPQGTTITNGLVIDPNNIQWSLPSSVVLPFAGQITVTATCVSPGAVNLATGQSMTAVNPTAGWQSTTTTAAATPGAPVEKDAQLRIRQSNSTTLPSQTRLDSIVSALWQITNVQRLRAYQNETGAVDTNGIPGNSIAIVIDGGDAATIAQTISSQKFACGTYGTTTETVTDDLGIPHPINFFYVSEPNIIWGITVHAASNYSVNTNALIAQSLAAYTNALGIACGGQTPTLAPSYKINLSRAYQAAYLGPLISQTATDLNTAVVNNDTTSIATLSAKLASLNSTALTYTVTSLTVGRKTIGTLSASDLAIAFNEAPAVPVNSDGTLVTSGDITVTIA